MKKKTIALVTAGLFISFSFIAEAQNKNDNQDKQNQSTTTGGNTMDAGTRETKEKSMMTEADKSFLKKASNAGMYEIEAANLAIEKSSSPEDYGYGTGSSYGSGTYGRGRETWRGSEYGRVGEGWRAEGSYSPYREEDDRNWFERAGDRVKEGWNDIKQRFSDDDDRGYQSRERYGRDDDRNFFERAGDRINDTWNDMRGRGDEDFDTDYKRRRGDFGRGYERNAYGRGTTSGWNTQGRGYDRDMDYPASRGGRYGRNYPSQGRYGY